MEQDVLATGGRNDPGMNPDNWRKILKIAIAILTALAGCLGVGTAASCGFFNIG
jgi:hypothetical protein